MGLKTRQVNGNNKRKNRRKSNLFKIHNETNENFAFENTAETHTCTHTNSHTLDVTRRTRHRKWPRHQMSKYSFVSSVVFCYFAFFSSLCCSFGWLLLLLFYRHCCSWNIVLRHTGTRCSMVVVVLISISDSGICLVHLFGLPSTHSKSKYRFCVTPEKWIFIMFMCTKHVNSLT